MEEKIERAKTMLNFFKDDLKKANKNVSKEFIEKIAIPCMRFADEADKEFFEKVLKILKDENSHIIFYPIASELAAGNAICQAIIKAANDDSFEILNKAGAFFLTYN